MNGRPTASISSSFPRHFPCSLHNSLGTDKESLFNNDELLKLVVISFILVNLNV